MSVNACFYVKTWRSNDGFLGDGSFAAGIRATELRPGPRPWHVLITGVSDAQFELLRWYFVEVDDDTGFDAAADVIARAVAKVAPGTAVEGSAPVAAIEARDLLDDLARWSAPTACGSPTCRRCCATLAPAWGPYRALTGVQLRDLLDDEGVKRAARVMSGASTRPISGASWPSAARGRPPSWRYFCTSCHARRYLRSDLHGGT